MTGTVTSQMAGHVGRFLDPDPQLADRDDLAAVLGNTNQSGYRALREAPRLAGASRIFDVIMADCAIFTAH